MTASDWVGLISAIGGAFAAIAAWWSAYSGAKSIEVTRALAGGETDTAKRQLRAYLGTDSLALKSDNLRSPNYTPPTVEPGKLIQDRLILVVKNFGNTPANGVVVTGQYHRNMPKAKLGNDFDFDGVIDMAVRGNNSNTAFVPAPTICPGQVFTFEMQIADMTEFRRAAAGENLIVYVFGRIDYLDVYQETRATRFCYIYDPGRSEGTQFIPYERYNEAT